MCGISGIASTEEVAAFRRDPLAALSHRGPDGGRIQSWKGERSSWTIAHTRLSIVDLSDAGLEPMPNEDNTLFLAFNGEIYNYPELRKLCESRGHRFRSSMDGEVIVHLWEDEGEKALDRLNGIFGIAIADARTGEVFLARDPVGVKPLFYCASSEGTLSFASEMAALKATGADLGPPDLVALAQFLTFLWVPHPRTPHTNVKAIEPGTVMRWDLGSISTRRYAPRLEPSVDPAPMLPHDAVKELERVFWAAVDRQLMADVPVGLMVSGGVDSSLIWKAAGEGITRGFCIEWPASSTSERLGEDTDAVKTLERRFGTPVTYIPGRVRPHLLSTSGDLFADPAFELTRQIAESATKHGFKVLLSGQGGDELFGGYRRHLVARWIDRVPRGRKVAFIEKMLRALPPTGQVKMEYAARVAHAMAERDPFCAYMHLCSYSTARDRARALDCSEREVADHVVWSTHREIFDSLPGELSFFRRAITLDLSIYLPGLGLAYVDRAGMASGVEIRVPWLDLELLRWSLTLPDELFVRKRQGKWLSKALAAEKLGSDIAFRPKRGFAAPQDRLETGDQPGGERGYRQGQYFTVAVGLLKRFIAEDGQRAI